MKPKGNFEGNFKGTPQNTEIARQRQFRTTGLMGTERQSEQQR
jgi:hypothetical protein